MGWSLSSLASGLLCYSAFRVSPHLSPQLTGRYHKLSPRDRIDWDSRFASTLHALAITSFAAYIFFATDTYDDDTKNPELAGQPILLRCTPVSQAALGVSLGYFVLDISLMVKHYPWMGGPEMLAHHIAAFASVYTSLSLGQAHIYTLIMLATEVTTPFVNARWILDKLQWRGTKTYTVNGVCLAVSWLLVRILLFLWFFIHAWNHRAETAELRGPAILLITIVPALLFGLNVFWFTKILRGVIKLISGQLQQDDDSDMGPRARYKESAAHKKGT